MKVDEKASKEARYRQIEAINRLNEFFGVGPTAALGSRPTRSGPSVAKDASANAERGR